MAKIIWRISRCISRFGRLVYASPKMAELVEEAKVAARNDDGCDRRR